MPLDLSGPNSVLQQYIAHTNAVHQQQQLDFERENAQQTHDLHLKQLNEAMKQHKEDLTLRHALTKAQLQQHLNENYGSPDQTPQSELDPQGNPPSQYFAGAQQGVSPETTEALGPIPIDPNYNIRKQKAALAQATALQGVKTQGTIEAEQGKVKAQTPLKLQELEERSKNTESTNQSRITAAKIAAESRRYAAQLNYSKPGKSDEIDPDALAARVHDLSSGNGPPLGQNKLDQHANAVLQSTGLQKLTSKQREAVNATQDLNSLFDAFDKLASVASTNNFGATVGDKIKGTIPNTDLNQAAQDIKARAPLAVRSIFGISSGRINQREIEAAIEGMGKPGQTQQNIINKSMKLRGDVYTAIMQDKLGNLPFDQKVKVLEDNGQFQSLAGKQIMIEGKIYPILAPTKDGNFVMLDPSAIKSGKPYKLVHGPEGQ